MEPATVMNIEQRISPFYGYPLVVSLNIIDRESGVTRLPHVGYTCSVISSEAKEDNGQHKGHEWNPQRGEKNDSA
jgi:hypothetical protein